MGDGVLYRRGNRNSVLFPLTELQDRPGDGWRISQSADRRDRGPWGQPALCFSHRTQLSAELDKDINVERNYQTNCRRAHHYHFRFRPGSVFGFRICGPSMRIA